MCLLFMSGDLPQDTSTDDLRMMASLLLEDLGQVNGLRKDKRRQDSLPTDEEVAVDLFAEELRVVLEMQDDRRMAQSLAVFVDMDNHQDFLDRTVASVLNHGEDISLPSSSSVTARRIPVAGGSGEPHSVKSSNGPASCNGTPDNGNRPHSVSCAASLSEQ